MVYLLADAPLRIYKRANYIYESKSEDLKELLRRIMVISINGGVPIDFIKSVGFEFSNYDYASLPVNSWLDTVYDPSLLQYVCNYFNYFQKFHSEANLRTILWDPLILDVIFSNGTQKEALEFGSEFKVEKVMDIGEDERRIDLTFLAEKYPFPVLLIEIGEEDIPFPFEHKDLTKLSTLMTVSCINLCQEVQRRGIDPSVVKVFGIFIGGSRFQFAVGKPVLTPKDDFNDISVNICFHEHWGFDLAGPGYETRSDICNGTCCNIEGIEDEPMFPLLPNNPRVLEVLDHFPFNEFSFRKFIGFLSYVKTEILKLNSLIPEDFALDDEKKKPIRPPSITYIPKAKTSHSSSTPKKSKIIPVPQLQFSTAPPNLNLSDGPDIFYITKRVSDEYFLYTEHFKFSHLFPLLYDIQVHDEAGKQVVKYTFENMKSIFVSGPFDPYSGSSPFASQFRAENGNWALLMDVTTFAVHILVGLNHLHENVGYIHSDISPRNLMFSEVGSIWKLNDFNCSMSIEESSETVRHVGTDGYIAPESFSTGIYTAASDVYSLGQVLSTVFDTNLLCKAVFSGDKLLSRAYDDFKISTLKMIKDVPSERANVLESLANFYGIIKRYPLSDFNLYGPELLCHVPFLLRGKENIGHPHSPTDIPVHNIAIS